MRLKKGFTLAEILIVLMVIGVIATMTLPSLMRGVQETQFKTGYKKAYNTISNWATMEKVAGSLPSRSNDDGYISVLKSLDANLSVSAYAKSKSQTGVGLDPSGLSTELKIGESGKETVFGKSGTNITSLTVTTVPALSSGAVPDAELPWIITEDGFAYSLIKGAMSSANCETKIELNSYEKYKAAAQKACYVVLVDVNGLTKGPNTMDENIEKDAALSDSAKMGTLTSDQFPILIGLDGATSGNKSRTVTGRIVSDIK